VSVLTLEGVGKKISSRQIVDDLHMCVEAGEVYGFLGPNGAGKTTTIRMIVGLARPSKGSIRILGHDVQRDRRAALSHVGAIVENPETYAYLTGRQNLLHYARLAGVLDVSTRIKEVGRIVGLHDRLDDKVKRYSLGMRQRLGVAQAILNRPKLLILDEPTNGLDPAGIREFRAMMRDLADSGMAVFVSSHMLSEIELMCDRVAILQAGRVIAEDRVSALAARSSSGVQITVGGDVDATVRLLTAAAWQAHVLDGQSIRVDVAEASVPALVRMLAAADIDVYAVRPLQDTLEEAFLELTQGIASSREGVQNNA